MKQSEKRKFIDKRDIIIIAVTLVVAAVGLFAHFVNSEKTPAQETPGAQETQGSQSTDDTQTPDGEPARLFATFFYKGVGVHAVYLDEDGVFSIEAFLPEVTFEVRDGAVAFIHSNCPDQLCVGMGWQSEVGGFAACLPNQVLFFIESEQAVDLDIVTQ